MSERDFAAFREMVFADKTLQDCLRQITDREAFVSLVVRLGRESGFHFAAADVTAAMARGHVAWLTSSVPIL